MQIPLNIIHFYVGVPILFLLAIDLFRRNTRRNNITTWYFACATLSLALSMLFFGVTALLTHDPRLLSLGTFAGDCFQSAAFLFFWFISIRVFFGSKPRLLLFANAVVVCLTIANMANAIWLDLTPPYSARIIGYPDGVITIAYAAPMLYKILTGLTTLSLVFVGFVFWNQSKNAPTHGQKFRLRAMACATSFGALIFIAIPSFPLSSRFDIYDILLSITLLMIAVSSVVGFILNKRSSKTNI